MSQGAPTGNQNAKKGKAWAEAIRRAIREKYEGEDYEAKLAKLARKLVDAADSSDMQALKEIGDRVDGKAHQTLEADVRGNLAEVLAGISSSNNPPLEG